MTLAIEEGGTPCFEQLDLFFERIAEEHRKALARVTTQSLRSLQQEDRRALERVARALQRENEKLTEEVASLRRFGIRRMVGDAPSPPLPQVPSSLECSAPAGGPPRIPMADAAMPLPPSEQGWRETKRFHPAPPEEMLPGTPMHLSESAHHDTLTCGSAEASELLPMEMCLTRSYRADLQSKLRSIGHIGDDGRGDRSAWHKGSTRSQRTHSTASKTVLHTTFQQLEVEHAEPQSQHTGNVPAQQLVKDRLGRKQRLRLRNLLGLTSNTREVTSDMLHRFFIRRDPTTPLDYDDVVRMITELKRVKREEKLGHDAEDSGHPGRIDLKILVDLLLDQDIVFRCHPAVRDDMEVFTQSLLSVTLEEIIDDATMLHGHALEDDLDDRPRRKCPSPSSFLNGVVTATVLFDILCLGLSMDYIPDSLLWFFIELFSAIVFATEASVKIWKFGRHEYFFGKDRSRNLMDCMITALSVLDVALTSFHLVVGQTGDETTRRFVLLLRALRLARVIRLVKLIRTRFLTNLVNMLTGFVLGLPALMWVVVLFLVILFIFGLLFRVMWGPSQGQDLTSVCGNPDVLVENPELMTPLCEEKLHWVYGEQFFGTVGQSMFTTFRFMLGDYQSRNGVSLAVVFGDGYGMIFRLAFAVGMILVVFGLFNIVTAIFVDSTISGLKHNDTMRKYAQQYEGKYVRGKLTELAERIGQLVFERTTASRVSIGSPGDAYRGRNNVCRTRHSAQDGACSLDNIALTCDEFVEVMEDFRVRQLLRDLDVEMYNAAALFDTFDGDESGTVTIPEMVQAIMRLRGEVRKNDLIASLVAVRSLGRRFDELMLCLPGDAQVARFDVPARPRTT